MTVAKILNGAALLGQKGPREFATHVTYRVSERMAETWLGVDTGGHFTKAELGLADPDAHEYSTVSYGAIYRLLRSLDCDWQNSAFVDYGAGKGRAVVTAATFPFKSVTGVELSTALAAAARENVRRMRRRKARHVEVVTTDATAYPVPADANVFYFYNPFAGKLLERVIANIHASVTAHPRPVSILYVNDDHFERLVNEQHPWLRCTQQRRFYPRLRCGIYHSR